MHLVMVLDALFCIVCSLVMFVSDVMGDQIVFAYSMNGCLALLYIALIIFSPVSLKSLDFWLLEVVCCFSVR